MNFFENPVWDWFEFCEKYGFWRGTYWLLIFKPIMQLAHKYNWHKEINGICIWCGWQVCPLFIKKTVKFDQLPSRFQEALIDGNKQKHTH